MRSVDEAIWRRNEHRTARARANLARLSHRPRAEIDGVRKNRARCQSRADREPARRTHMNGTHNRGCDSSLGLAVVVGEGGNNSSRAAQQQQRITRRRPSKVVIFAPIPLRRSTTTTTATTITTNYHQTTP